MGLRHALCAEALKQGWALPNPCAVSSGLRQNPALFVQRVTTEQYAIVVSGAVGALGIVSPAIVSWVQRTHERELARIERLHTQRLDLYREVGRFLETEHLRLASVRLEDLLSGPPPEPFGPTREEWVRLRADAAVAGSEDARRATENYYSAQQRFVAHLVNLRHLFEHRVEPQTLAEFEKEIHHARAIVLDNIAEVERIMRVELERL
jgi:hypothetical protein